MFVMSLGRGNCCVPVRLLAMPAPACFTSSVPHTYASPSSTLLQACWCSQAGRALLESMPALLAPPMLEGLGMACGVASTRGSCGGEVAAVAAAAGP